MQSKSLRINIGIHAPTVPTLVKSRSTRRVPAPSLWTMDANEFRANGQAVIELIAQYFETIEQRPVTADV